MPRYVILRHDMPAHAQRPAHWDLMLETSGCWRPGRSTASPEPGGRWSPRVWRTTASTISISRVRCRVIAAPSRAGMPGNIAWGPSRRRPGLSCVHGDRLVGQLVLQAAAGSIWALDRPIFGREVRGQGTCESAAECTMRASRVAGLLAGDAGSGLAGRRPCARQMDFALRGFRCVRARVAAHPPRDRGFVEGDQRDGIALRLRPSGPAGPRRGWTP